MQIHECEIQYSRWFYPKKQNILHIIVISCVLHLSLLLLLYFMKSDNLLTFQQDKAQSTASEPIHIRLENLPSQEQIHPEQQKKRLEKNQGKILTDTRPSDKNKFLVPKHQAASIPKIPSQQKTEKKPGIERFLPQYSQNYIDTLRQQARPPDKRIQADSGDIPIQGPDLTPRNGALVQERYATKDLSLFQFSLEFHDKFGAIWNSKERWVPPSSPLRPGDVVYYKFYIYGNGTLQKFENLTKLQEPGKDFSGLDNIISEVIAKVFPIKVPQKFNNAKNVITDVVAIQVVNANRPMQFSF